MSDEFRRLRGPIPTRLDVLRKKRAHWIAVRAARKALFTRPTPIADRLRAIANLRRTIDYAYMVIVVLVGVRFIWHLSGVDASRPLFRGLELLTDPLIWPLEEILPPIRIGPTHWIELAAPATVLAVGITVRLLNWLIQRVAHRKLHYS